MNPTASPTPFADASPPAMLARPAVLASDKSLPAEARKQIMDLSGARPLRYGLELALTWLCIAALVAIAVRADNLGVSILCIMLISTRQNVLGLLLHEQVHRLGLRSKHADWIVNFFAGFPLLVTTVENYAKVHLSHHKYCFTKDDPDFIRKSGEEWTFPMPLGAMLRIFARDVTGMNVPGLIRGKKSATITEFERRNPTPKWLRLVFFALLATGLTLAGGWKLFLLYWIVPLLTFTQLLIRWGAICEHQYNIENGELRETTPLIILPWWEKLLAPDQNFGYHLYHHMHPGVSFAQLPVVHGIYVKAGLVDESAIFRGRGGFLRRLVAG